MANRIEYFDDLSWVVDPNNEIENMFKKHKEKKKQKYRIPFEDGKIMEVDFKEDHEFSMLMEYQDELYDLDGNFIFNKKIVKNWEYYSQELDDFLFYIDKAKYLMRNYNYYKKELEYMRQGLHLRKMSYEMMVAVIDNLKFVDRCFETRLAEHKQYLYPIYVERISFSEMAEKLNMAKSSLQTTVWCLVMNKAMCEHTGQQITTLKGS